MIQSIWKTGSDFLDRFELTESDALLFQPLTSPLPAAATPGALLRLHIVFEDRRVDFDVYARVKQREDDGLLLAFVPEERRALELVLTSARGESLPYFRRRHPRISIQLPVVLELAAGGAQEETITLSISEGGARLALASLEPPEEARVRLTITFPTGERQRVHGRVTSVAPDGPLPSLGVEFRFSSAAERDRLSARVRSLVR